MTSPDTAGGRRIVVAPDSFKGSIRAVDVARAITDGWRSAHPEDDVTLVPMADGGEGTLDAFAEAMPGARRIPVVVSGPLGAPHETAWLLVPERDEGTDLGVVELAGTAGIELVDPTELRPLDASSRGFGEAIRAALDHRVHRLVLAIGSSASSDGGAGMLQALGARAVDADGSTIADGARGLDEMAALDLSGLAALPPGGVTVLTDVVSPLLGPDGTAAVFSPQKGADESDVARIEHALARWATFVDADAGAAGAGAAGGIGFALLAWGAHLTPGARAVAELVGLDDRVREADVVITGEGRYDEQSDRGKAPSIVLRAALNAGVRSAVIAGVIATRPRDVAAAVSLTTLSGSSQAAMTDAAHWLRRAGRELALQLGRRA